MAIVRNTKIIDSKCRVSLPKEWAKPGDVVYFDITKTGSLIIKKMPGTKDKEVDLDGE